MQLTLNEAQPVPVPDISAGQGDIRPKFPPDTRTPCSGATYFPERTRLTAAAFR
jgi:hypothetical protein